MGKLSEEQKALLTMTYNEFGKLVEFQYDVYGFVGSNNRVRLVNTDTFEILDKELSIRYIGDNVIILGNYNVGVNIKFVILDRKTLNTLYECNKELVKIGDIIYERSYNEFVYGNSVIRNIFNLEGKLIGSISLQGELIIEDTDNPKYYIVTNKIFNSVITASVTDILLQTYFITSRPQIFTFLIFIILLFYHGKSSPHNQQLINRPCPHLWKDLSYI